MATNKSRSTKYYANMLALIFHLRNHYMTSQLIENKNDNLIYHIVNDELLPSKNWQKSLKCVALLSINTRNQRIGALLPTEIFLASKSKIDFFISQDSKKSSEDNLSRKFFTTFYFNGFLFTLNNKSSGECVFLEIYANPLRKFKWKEKDQYEWFVNCTIVWATIGQLSK